MRFAHSRGLQAWRAGGPWLRSRVADLTPDLVAQFREAAPRTQPRRGAKERRVLIDFADGPLAGLRVTTEASATRSAYIALCVPADCGPVQVLYRPEHPDERGRGPGNGRWILAAITRAARSRATPSRNTELVKST
jgi:hypothetical protein